MFYLMILIKALDNVDSFRAQDHYNLSLDDKDQAMEV